MKDEKKMKERKMRLLSLRPSYSFPFIFFSLILACGYLR